MRNSTRLFSVLLALLAGCATAPEFEQRPGSVAFSDPGSTSLGKRLAPVASEHPGLSGFRLLDAPQADMQARVTLAALAERSIDAQYFIWQDDAAGTLLAGALVAAADRGVRVRILVDDFYLGGRDARLAAFDRHPNLEIRVFNPVVARRTALTRGLGLAVRFRRLNHRMHNKQFLVDGSFGVVGGRNVADEYFGLHREFNLRDRDVLAAGPVVAELGASFDEYWNGSWAIPFEALTPARPKPKDVDRVLSSVRSSVAADDLAYPIRSSAADLEEVLETSLAELVWARSEVHWDRPEAPPEGPDASGFTRVRDVLLSFMAEARQELLLETPYLAWREPTLEALGEATRAGVEVRIVTNSLASTDMVPAQAVYADQRSELLAGGARIFELRPDAAIAPRYSPPDREPDAVLGLHAKSIVRDRQAVYVGSYNLDPRSAELNSEIALIVHSPELAGQIADTIERDTRPENSWEVVLDESGEPTWLEPQKGEVLHHRKPPRTSWTRRFEAGLISILPIDSQI